MLLLAFHERLARYGQLLGLLRCVAGVAAVFLLLRGDLGLVAPLLGLGLIPVTGRRWNLGETVARIFVAELGANQLLQTYPVAGSQVAIASAPVVLWAFVCMSDGVEEWRIACASQGWGKRPLGWLVALGLVVAMWSSGTWHWGYAYPSSGLRGAGWLHLPPEQARTLRQLSADIGANCSELFTTPRMASFHFWSGIAAPDLGVTPPSSKLYTAAEGQAIVARLDRNPGVCVLYNRSLLEFWHTTPADLEESGLAEYLLRRMPEAEVVAGYELRVHPRRETPWVRQAPGD